MALCRDVPFAAWDGHADIDAARESMGRLWWFRADRTDHLDGVTDTQSSAQRRRRHRILSQDGSEVPLDALFRGETFGERAGPYLSQFLLIGNAGVNGKDAAHDVADGYISYGAVRTDQRVRTATPSVDYMTSWPEILDVQNGADVRGREAYESDAPPGAGYRFITTPRDLATYVHYDALYVAYLNACLILIGFEAKLDPGLPFQRQDHIDRQQGFAVFGGPHLLTLVTEVATRALKAVRYQKFNVHRRLRPEAVGGWMYQWNLDGKDVRARLRDLEQMHDAFAGSSQIGARLDAANGNDNWLLPMAFPEGSPVHPAYGAGHATVAGACVTVLKAWFDAGQYLLHKNGDPLAYVPTADGTALDDVAGSLGGTPLTVEGELNKVAANIAIGRNWGGVHYYSDYIESFRLGEQVALGLLEEQKLTYGENFSLTVPLFDGTTVRI